MGSRLSIDEYYLKMLELVAARSTCVRRAVGAIIVDKENHVLSTGYNGVPKGFSHCIDKPCAGASDNPGDSSNCMAVHAEQNAILQCNSLSRAYTIYCSCLPCFVCSKLLSNTRIHVIVCKENYADKRGLKVLLDSHKIVIIEGKRVLDYNGEKTT